MASRYDSLVSYVFEMTRIQNKRLTLNKWLTRIDVKRPCRPKAEEEEGPVANSEARKRRPQRLMMIFGNETKRSRLQ